MGPTTQNEIITTAVVLVFVLIILRIPKSHEPQQPFMKDVMVAKAICLLLFCFVFIKYQKS